MSDSKRVSVGKQLGHSFIGFKYCIHADIIHKLIKNLYAFLCSRQIVSIHHGMAELNPLSLEL